MSYRRVAISLASVFVLLLAGEFYYRHFIGDGQADNPAALIQPVEAPVAQAPPLPPRNVRIAHQAPGLVRLAWDKGTSANAHQVAYWHAGDSGSEWIVLPQGGIQLEMDVVPGTGAIISNLPEHPEQIHHFTVRAVIEGAHSAWTKTISTAPPSRQPQADAGQLQTSVLSVIDNQDPFDQNPVARVATRLNVPQEVTGRYQSREAIALDWNDVPGADAYQVRVWDPANVKWSLLPNDQFQVDFDGSQAQVGFSFLDDFDLSMKSKLLFSVRAVGDTGGSSWSRPIDIDLILDTPQGLSGQLQGGRIRLDWPDVPLADFYEIRFRSHADANAQWIMLSEATNLGWTMDGSSADIDLLPNSETFEFQVRAITGDYQVCSDWSNVLTMAQLGEPGTPPGDGTTPDTVPTTTDPETPSNTLERTSRPTPQPTPRPTPTPTADRTTEPNPRPTATPDPGTTTGGTTGSGTGTDSQNDLLMFFVPEEVNLSPLDIRVNEWKSFGISIGSYPENISEEDVEEVGRVLLSFQKFPANTKICFDKIDSGGNCLGVEHKIGKHDELENPKLGELQISYSSKSAFALKVEDASEDLELTVGVKFAEQSGIYYCGMNCPENEWHKPIPIAITITE